MNESFKQQNTVPDQNIDPEKVNRWEAKRNEIDQMGDRLGKGIDENIKETVVALNMYDLPTRNSCEGHLDHGVPFPFADVEAPGKPIWKREGEKELFESVAREKNIPLEKLNRESPEWDVDLYEEVLGEAGRKMNEMADEGKELPDTEEYHKWKQENKKLHTRARELLKEFYAEQQPSNKDTQIFIDGEDENGFNIRPQGGFERFVDALVWRQHINEERAQGHEMPLEELQKLSERLAERRAEMDRFTKFLKEKFVSNSELQQELREQLKIGEKNENEKFFENLKRPYGVEDIKNFQRALAEFEEKRKKESASFVFDYNNFYQFLTSSRKREGQEALPGEKEIPVKDYEELELGIFQEWRQNLLQNQERVLQSRPKLAEVIKTLQNEPPPQNLDELRDLYRRFPTLNDVSAVSYQEGIGEKLEKRSGFLHINMARCNAYKYEMPEADTRIYLNPPIEAIPKLSMHLVGLAEKEKIPLYFKVIDYSFQKFTPENAGRLDKMLVYTDKENAPKLAKIIEELQQKRPQWFQGRELPNFVAPIGEGVGIAAEPSEFQKQKFGEQGKSFNSVRALFMREVWRDATKDILIANKDIRPRGGRTFQQIFNDQLKSSLGYLKLDRGTVNRYIDQVWQAELDSEKLGQEIKNKIGRELEDTLLLTMQDVVPSVTPDSLAIWVGRRIEEKAPQYGINQENIALNK